MLADMDPQFYAVVVKALLVHRAHWNSKAALLKDICGPEDKRQHVARSENACRFIGFGVPETNRRWSAPPNGQLWSDMGCCSRRTHTVIGFHCQLVRRVTDPRLLTVTIAWFSPIKPSHQRYRCVRLEAAPLYPPVEVLGVERLNQQPAYAMVIRGTIFHEHFYGKKAVPFIDDGHLSLRVW